MPNKVDKYNIARILRARTYLVGGSFLVNPEAANDIDIIVHEFHHPDFQDSLRDNGFHALQEGDEKYDEIDHQRLIEVYEGRIDGVKYNIIVVGATYWPAYEAAIYEMKRNPKLYDTREKRIALHKGNCKVIREMIGVLDDDFVD